MRRVGALLAGFGLGFAVAAGFGPINVLCLTCGLRFGFAPAWGVGLGAACVDGLYALLAGAGAAALLTGSAHGWLQVAGGAALVAVAARMARAGWRRRADGADGPDAASLAGMFRLSFAATLANPLTIVSWAAVFAGVVPRLDLGRAETLAALPVGIAAGTLTWFTIVSAGAAFASRFAGERALARLSLAAAAVIGGFGAWFIVSGAAELA